MRPVAFVLCAGVLLVPATAAGQGAPTQRTRALYEQACDSGDLVACNVFGLMNETGEGVPQDYARARELYGRACDGGLPVGCTNLGLIYGRGLGVEQDLERARAEYDGACAAGNRLGCDLVAVLDSVGVAAGDETEPRYFKVGRVADAESARTLSDAIVTVPALGVQVVSDPDGRVELGRIPEGRYAITAERFGFEPLDGTLEVPGSAEFLMLMSPAQIGDPLATGRVVGRVVDVERRAPLPDVVVTVVGQDRGQVLSNQKGAFALRGVRPGLVRLRFTRLGYAPRTAALIVQPGEKGELTETLSTEAIELPAIDVTATGRVPYLERTGFYQRQDRVKGTQFTREDVELYATSAPLHMLVTRAPNVRVELIGQGGGGPVWYAVNPRVQSGRTADPGSPALGGGACILPVYLDGVRLISPNLDEILTSDVEAVEVYSGGDTPVEYAGTNACGVVLVWTRR